MDNSYKDELPILLSGACSQLPDESMEVELIKRLDARCTTRSSSMSLPYYSSEVSYESQSRPVYHTGPLLGRGIPQIPKKNAENPFLPSLQKMGGNPANVAAEEFSSVHVSADQGWEGENYTAKNEHLLRSGPLGRCNDPYCTTCPTYYPQPSPRKKANTVSSFETKLHNTIYGGGAKGWIRKPFSFLGSCVPGIMNPHAKAVQRWNKFFVISCLVAIFIDPLFFFLLSVQEVEKCIVLNWSLATTIAVVRSVTDFLYFLHILLQFRLAYVAPESRVVGAGDLVDVPKKIAFHYLRGRYFFLDLFVVLPLPQITILFVLPKYVGSSAANYAKNLLRATVLLQYIPRIVRFVPLVIGQSASGFIFESAWANFVINLLIFILAGHVVGSCWYLFGLQRVNQCLRSACSDSTISKFCKEFIDCGRGNDVDSFRKRPEWESWRTNANATKCFDPENKFYGIYSQVVAISTKHSIVTRYVYSLFWGFQQISTLAGNQIPSAFVWEVLFTMGIIGLGLLLFALLIGNMQNFLLSLGRRRLEMQLRRRDVEQWMSHRRLPEELRRLVRQSERFNWAATQGVNEDMLLDKLPDDLQRKIRRHLFKLVKKVRIFTLLDEPIIDAICEKLRQKLYIEGSKIMYRDGPIDTMVFIVRGNMESVGGDGNISPLKEGDVCGEELLTWCLVHSSGNKERRKAKISGHRLLSNRTVQCLTNVDAFALRVADLEEVTACFARYLRNPRVQGVIRYASPYWRTMAATRIQVAWRYRKKRLNRSSDRPDHQQSTQWSRVPVSRMNEVMGR